MSGIEIAGLVLGALPVLFEALDGYKKGFGRLKAGFRKRECVRKLANALRLQAQSLSILTQDVLLYSGCTPPSDEAQLYTFIGQKSTRDEVDEFLGTANAQVLMEALDDCLNNVRNAAAKVAELVPSIKNNSEIQAILYANETAKQGQVDFFARLTLVVSLGDIERDIEALDKSSNTLDRFATRLLTNARTVQSNPSRKAIKLAKLLRVTRKHANNLHIAITNHWPSPCHPRHELKLFLDDRTKQNNQRQSSDKSQSRFRVILSGYVSGKSVFRHDTFVHVTNEEDQDLVTSQQTKVQIIISPVVKAPKQSVTVAHLCSAIEEATLNKCQANFHLSEERELAMSLESAIVSTQCQHNDSITLESILNNAATQNRLLPWKSRMVLAVKLASSFLQLLRTSWMQTYWSAGRVHFLLNSTNSYQADLSYPYISSDFNGISSTPVQRQAQIKDDLINLGILLLEIWHAKTLEAHFPVLSSPMPTPGLSTASTPTSAPTPGTIHTRHLHALQWLDDVEDPLPDLYNKAVSHCVVGISVTELRTCNWDDMELWKAVCENVVEPLSKLSQM